MFRLTLLSSSYYLENPSILLETNLTSLFKKSDNFKPLLNSKPAMFDIAFTSTTLSSIIFYLISESSNISMIFCLHLNFLLKSSSNKF